VPDPAARHERVLLRGDPPNAINLPTGCRFHTRCPHAEARCREEQPRLRSTGDRHEAACHFLSPPKTPAKRAAIELADA
jgi:oligopeptide/dipeptide ABC transporter ATP-binding protein